MITQYASCAPGRVAIATDFGIRCSIRHLYTLNDLPQPEKDGLISTAKTMERRRCNHHTLDEPLSTLGCLSNVIDSKKSLTNKHRYIVASQDEDVRRFCREIKGVPLVYVKRSVMVMEPMAEGSVGVREDTERSKFRSGLRGRSAGLLGKRKRGEDEGTDVDAREDKPVTSIPEGDETAVKKKKAQGPKGPNPLSVKKAKKGNGSVPKIFDSRKEGQMWTQRLRRLLCTLLKATWMRYQILQPSAREKENTNYNS